MNRAGICSNLESGSEKVRKTMKMYAYVGWGEPFLVLMYLLEQTKLQISLNYAVISENGVFWRVVLPLKAVEVNWFPVTHILANIITNINSCMVGQRLYRSPGMWIGSIIVVTC